LPTASRVRDITVGADVADKDVIVGIVDDHHLEPDDPRPRRRSVWATRRDARLSRARLLVIRPHGIYEPAFASAIWWRSTTSTRDRRRRDRLPGSAGARFRGGRTTCPWTRPVLGVVDRVNAGGRPAMAAEGAARDPASLEDGGRGMIRGTVIGQIWATRKARGPRGADAAPGGGARRRRRPDRTADRRQRTCSTARAGEDVTVALGSGARNVLKPGLTTATSCATRRSPRSWKGPTDVPRAGRGDRLVDGEVAQAKGLKLLLVRRIAWVTCRRAPSKVAPARPRSPTDDLVVCADILDAGPATSVWSPSGSGPRRHQRQAAAGDEAERPDRRSVVAVVDRVALGR
jgi:microcompartment protein CcmK/EutM